MSDETQTKNGLPVTGRRRTPELRGRPRGNLDAKRNLLLGKIAKEFFDRHELTALNFRDRGQQFVFIFGTEFKGLVCATSQHGDLRTFRQ